MQTRVAVVVFPTPGGPDSKAALNIEPSSFPAIKSEKTNILSIITQALAF